MKSKLNIPLLLIFAFVFFANTQLSLAESANKQANSQPPKIASNEAEWRYSVRPGDSLIRFAEQHLINPNDWRTLQTLNKITTPHRMRAGQIIRVPLHLVKQLPAPAEVSLSSGNAGVLKADTTIEPVTAGQKLSAGAILVTADKSKLNIKFADGSIVSMQPNSVLKLDTLSIYSGGAMVDTTLRLQQGKLETEANPTHVLGNKMQIITPTAVAAVRGTIFRVSTSDTAITQETLEGKVALIAAGDEVAVDKGFGSLSEGGAPPLPPILLIPAPEVDLLSRKLESLPATFSMPAQDGAVAWLGKVSTEASFNSIAAENLSQGNQLNFNDLPDGQYFLKVRAKDKQGLEGYDATHAFVLNAQPFSPKAVAPAQAMIIREPSPELTWTIIADAKTYLIELAKDAEFKELLETKQVANARYKLEKPLAAGQYFWRLASIAGSDQGPYSAANTFSYKPKPIMPDISQLKVQVRNNKVFVNTADAPDDLRYEATLHNELNQQKNVWRVTTKQGTFSFLLKEYGKQTLNLRYIDADGVTGPDAIVEFIANPQ